MKQRSYSDEGIVLARRNYGEADRILSVYTKNHGRVSFIAKGIRRPASRKRGHLEVFNQFKFQAASGRGLDMLTEAEIIESFSEVRKSLKKISLAYYFMEVIGRITHEGERNEELYSHVLENLRMLKFETKLKALRTNFVYNLLTVLGYWPRGKALISVDEKLEEVIERNISSVRVGKRLVE